MVQNFGSFTEQTDVQMYCPVFPAAPARSVSHPAIVLIAVVDSTRSPSPSPTQKYQMLTWCGLIAGTEPLSGTIHTGRELAFMNPVQCRLGLREKAAVRQKPLWDVQYLHGGQCIVRMFEAPFTQDAEQVANGTM